MAIQFKTLGYIALEVTKKTTKKGRIRRVVTVLSNKIRKTLSLAKADATRLKNKARQRYAEKVVRTCRLLRYANNEAKRLKGAIASAKCLSFAKRWRQLPSLFVEWSTLKFQFFRFFHSIPRSMKNDVQFHLLNSGRYDFNLNNLIIA